MNLQDVLKEKQWKDFVMSLPNFDPYKSKERQCNGRCPKQRYEKVKK